MEHLEYIYFVMEVVTINPNPFVCFFCRILTGAHIFMVKIFLIYAFLSCVPFLKKNNPPPHVKQ